MHFYSVKDVQYGVLLGFNLQHLKLANESWRIIVKFPKIYWEVAGTMKYNEKLVVLNNKVLYLKVILNLKKIVYVFSQTHCD